MNSDELHALHNNYPLASEKLAITYDMLSGYCKKTDKYEVRVGDVKKLIPNLSNDNNYVLYCRNLQLYLFSGMKLTKIHTVLRFKLSDWMKKYIDFNTKNRTNAANSFKKDFFKLMINSVYGKTMENLRKRINVRLVNNEKDILKYTSRPTHITHKIFGKNHAAVREVKPVLKLNKPIYVGVTVIELSKWLVYFGAKLLVTDTDSLTYEIIPEGVYEEFFKHKYLLDVSNYPEDSNFFDQAKKTVIDKMKDESEAKIIGELVGLKSKMYSMKNING